MKRIILNADVGEEIGFDAEIMPFISWCNIACGSHAGNEEVIQKTINLAIENNVKIGAHPSYPDRENFGRKVMSISYEDLVQSITGQIRLVKFYVEQKGETLHHVKPHGALYNHAVKNREVAKAIIESVKNIDKDLYLITPKDSEISYLSKGVLNIKFEAFADRNYNEDLTLVSRSENESVITDPEHVFDHVFKMVSQGKIKTKRGEELPIFFDTICIHGDTQNVVEILKFLRAEFTNRNFMI
ncbi:5-oxoprolinase subunit PxpA [Aquimarina sp. MMG016]|uniref:5-oxoprolinase subunit PxpA n=1 Tax=Aquimarina sp. MMG016 TaxID=2822690 RepID=UPI001B3A729D|nr:5-oxoprolinase subunit PxpA [Aquimarina sp. MMG016]MBQ4821032.1 5-oxoprolinase subunit PxpA [Aquimarina sp. MMG016]